jgi:hypothetical protein
LFKYQLLSLRRSFGDNGGFFGEGGFSTPGYGGSVVYGFDPGGFGNGDPTNSGSNDGSSYDFGSFLEGASLMNLQKLLSGFFFVCLGIDLIWRSNTHAEIAQRYAAKVNFFKHQGSRITPTGYKIGGVLFVLFGLGVALDLLKMRH